MPRFGVFRNPEGAGYLLDVQADLLSHLNTRVVIPLLPLELAPQPARTLNPIFEIEGQRLMLATQFLAAIPQRLLAEHVADLRDKHTEITNALDLLFQGF